MERLRQAFGLARVCPISTDVPDAGESRAGVSCAWHFWPSSLKKRCANTLGTPLSSRASSWPHAEELPLGTSWFLSAMNVSSKIHRTYYNQQLSSFVRSYGIPLSSTSLFHSVICKEDRCTVTALAVEGIVGTMCSDRSVSRIPSKRVSTISVTFLPSPCAVVETTDRCFLQLGRQDSLLQWQESHPVQARPCTRLSKGDAPYVSRCPSLSLAAHIP